jgi:CBS domain-containing protein
LSPRAAWRLESLGFSQVFDYVAGKADWFAAGLPRVGRDASVPRAGDAARQDVPLCRLGDRVGEVRTRLRQEGWDQCLVVNEQRIVLGRLRGKALDAVDQTPVEEIMEPGPTTIRPDTLLDAELQRMHERHVASIVVTTSDGRLVGMLVHGEADRHGSTP